MGTRDRQKAKRSKAFAWLITLIFGGITILSLSALVMLVPLKSFEPYIVEVDKNTGYIEVKTGLTRTSNITDQQAVTQANVVRYIRSREGYDPLPSSRTLELQLCSPPATQHATSRPNGVPRTLTIQLAGSAKISRSPST